MPMTPTYLLIARCLILSIAFASLPVRLANAGMVTTDQVLASRANAGQAANGTSRERVEAFLARTEVRAEMEKNGVDPSAASARVAALSDAEVDALAGKLDTLPAGGDFGGIVGAAVFIFLVLLITDLLGLTKVFSFTRSIK